jgi:transposase, IS30 family
MSYHHLSAFERMEIQTLLQLGYSPAEIAPELERPLSTITRELERNGGPLGRYSAVDAQRRYLDGRKRASKASKFSDEALRCEVEEMLKQEHSPEQIARRLPLLFPDSPDMRVSHETIYQHVYSDKRRGGKLHGHLRQGRKKRRKRGNSKGRRGVIAGRVSIEERPAIVAAQGRVGDWEGDTVIGKNHKCPLATFVERSTLYTAAGLMPDKRAESLNNAAKAAFKEIDTQLLHTITVDNGKEFAAFKALEKELGVDIYFSRTYTPNDRAINENTNGLFRQYLPKGTDFTTLTQDHLNHILDRLNNRPRKKLGFRTPREALEQALVALQL